MMVFAQRRNVLQEISSTPLVSRAVDSESNVVLIPDSFLTPSPEEQIIRQRSQRRMSTPPFTVSYNIEYESKGQETPGKVGTTLCSATRKRLLLTPPKSQSSPIKDKTTKAKKARLHRKANCVPLNVSLQAYTTQQLVHVIDRLVSSHPELHNEVKATLPSPDLKPLDDQLNQLQRNIFKAFPSTRWGSSRDAYCYKRVKLHLDTFKKACIEQGRVLAKAQCWEGVVQYVQIAWKYVNQLPKWDDPSHNDSRNQCFRNLAAQCLLAIKKGSFEKEVLRDLKIKLTPLVQMSKEIHACISRIEQTLDKML